jgi:hypothetical protein
VNLRSDAGVGLVLVLMAVVLMSALGAALVLTTSTESGVAANFRMITEAHYAAEAAADWAVIDLSTAPDWEPVLDGTLPPVVVDGAPSGLRTLPDGTMVDLDAAAVAIPGGRVYANGWASAFIPGAPSPFYFVVVVGPLGLDSTRLMVRADAVGPRGVRSTAEVAVARHQGLPGGLRVLSRRAGR